MSESLPQDQTQEQPSDPGEVVLIGRLAKQLELDKVAYTYPPVDQDGRPWSCLNGSIVPEIPVFEQPTGQATMRIKRTAWGFSIWPPPGMAIP